MVYNQLFLITLILNNSMAAAGGCYNDTEPEKTPGKPIIQQQEEFPTVVSLDWSKLITYPTCVDHYIVHQTWWEANETKLEKTTVVPSTYQIIHLFVRQHRVISLKLTAILTKDAQILEFEPVTFQVPNLSIGPTP